MAGIDGCICGVIKLDVEKGAACGDDIGGGENEAALKEVEGIGVAPKRRADGLRMLFEAARMVVLGLGGDGIDCVC